MPRQPQALDRIALVELEGQDPHADEVGAVDALELSAMTARTPEQRVPLAAQSRLLPVPYSRPASTTRGTPSAA